MPLHTACDFQSGGEAFYGDIPPFDPSADCIVQDGSRFIQIACEPWLQAWEYDPARGCWKESRPEIERSDRWQVSQRLTPAQATRRVLVTECAPPETKDTEVEIPSDLERFVRDRLQPTVSDDKTLDRLIRALLPDPLAAGLTRFSNGRWDVMRLASWCDGSADLMGSNPALLWAIASSLNGATPPARKLLLRRQRALCDLLGLGDAESARRIFTKIAPESCSPAIMKELPQLQRDDGAMKILRHLPRITTAASMALARPWLRRRVKPAFFHELVEPHAVETMEAIVEIFSILRQVPVSLVDRVLPSSMSFGHMLQLWKEREVLIRIWHDDGLSRNEDDVSTNDGPLEPGFWPSPFPPPRGSLQIRNKEDLVQEGKIQKNCVACRLKDIHRGRCIIFKMLSPDRATWEIVRNPNQTWRIGDAERSGNRPVRSTTRRLLNKWLNHHLNRQMHAKRAGAATNSPS